MTDTQTITALYRAENEAMVTKDVARLAQILAPTMTLTHMTGYVQPKLEWIDQIQNEEMRYFNSEEVGLEILQVSAHQASLIGQNKVKASVWGSAVHVWPLAMKMYFIKDNGVWLISKQEASTF